MVHITYRTRKQMLQVIGTSLSGLDAIGCLNYFVDWEIALKKSDAFICELRRELVC